MPKHATSSSSEGDEQHPIVDEKKRKRKISNRESARRSRMKREQHIKDLVGQITFLQNNNNEIVQKLNFISQQFMAVETENHILTTHRDELRNRLESLEIVSSYVCGYLKDAPQRNPQPWLLPHQSLPLMASTGFFQF
uniref:BZIP12 n=1 Tax=Diospyros kaki TaxID=35925 RepID=A0A5P9PAJ8_DIOKA|nr:bZIP12 [Diospyros kaki]